MEKKALNFKDGIILFCCVLIMALTMGIVNMVLSIFFPIVSVDLGVSRPSFALTGTITALSSMVAALFWGFFYGKNAIQKPMIIGMAALGISFFGLQASQNLFHFYLLSLFIGLIYSGVSIIPVSTIVTRHFTRNTGFALSLALAGSGLGAMVLNPIVNTIVNTQGWRAGYQLLAIVVLAVALPSAILVTHLVRDEIQARPITFSGKGEKDTNPYLKSLWFWAFLFAGLLAGLTGAGALANMPGYLKDLHFSVSRISFVTSAYAASMIVGKFTLGFLYDRLGAKKATLIAGSLFILSMIFMILIKATPFLILMLICIGMGVSIGTVSLTWMTNYFFGKENYSKYYGSVQFSNSLGIAIGVPMISLMLENSGNFVLIWLLIALLGLLMITLFLYSIKQNQIQRSIEIVAEAELA